MAVQDIEAVYVGMQMPIRSMDAQKYTAAAIVVMQSVARAYCGANVEQTTPAFWSECARFLAREFSGIGVEEVRNAFSLSAAGKTGENIIAYKGVFTLEILGRVMAAYMEYRQKITAAIILEREAVKAEQENAERIEAQKQYFEFEVNRIKSLLEKNDMIEKWEQVPGGWYRICDERGWIKQGINKPPLWLQAKNIAVSKAKREVSGLFLSANEVEKVRVELSKNPDVFPEKLKAYAVYVYEKMLVLESLTKYSK